MIAVQLDIRAIVSGNRVGIALDIGKTVIHPRQILQQRTHKAPPNVLHFAAHSVNFRSVLFKELV